MSFTEVHIERAVVATFGQSERAEARSALGSYRHPDEESASRGLTAIQVKMAILMLANGDLGELKRLVETANKDCEAVFVRLNANVITAFWTATNALGMVVVPTGEEVERAAIASFGQSKRAEVLSKLDSHRPGNRVKAAILVLANGDMAELSRLVEVARIDYRDVLYWAEEYEETESTKSVMAARYRQLGLRVPESLE